MKQKSLRQLARELGVSASYLSQIRHGKRPASDKLLSNSLTRFGTSNPSGGINSVFGGFDSHALPPLLLNFYHSTLLYFVIWKPSSIHPVMPTDI
ncbi:MAG TPA: helix-turn-helix transcriptional regulator [Dehalococcoidia bacterium]|nr:helix-turn-helix transcriptional regulator [Dehalococcoidia bacterium]